VGQGAGYKLSVERTPAEIKAEEQKVKKEQKKKRTLKIRRAQLKVAAITAFKKPDRDQAEEEELNKAREKAISGFAQRTPKVKEAHQHNVDWVKNHPPEGFRAASLTERHGRYAKIWLLNAKDINGNGWGVSQVNLAKNLKSFLGRPYVITAKQFIANSEYMDTYDHPYIHTNDIPTILNYQEKFRVGNIIDVTQQGDDYFATVEVRPKFAHLNLPAFCSPAIFQMDPRESQQKISKWVGLHLAGLDENPAYGARIALLRGTCNGPRGQCMTQLQTAKKIEHQLRAGLKAAQYRLAEVMSDDDFRKLIKETFGMAGRNKRKQILEDAMEADTDTAKRFDTKFNDARNNNDFSKIRGETQAQTDFIDFGTKINPSKAEGGTLLDMEERKKLAKKNQKFAMEKLTPPSHIDGGEIQTKHDVTINPQDGREIADGYDSLEHNPSDPKVQEAYSALIQETGEQFRAIQKQGLKLTRVPDNGQNPYANSQEMHDDIEKNHNLSYFPTEAGFGSDGDAPADHPLLQETEFEHAGKKLLANDLFRIVHDINGHHHGDKSSFGPKEHT
jgi:hypothetical protein